MPLPAPPAGLVRVTHAGLGGVEAPCYYSVQFYRDELYDAGWRSVDDPDYAGSVSSSPHLLDAAAQRPLIRGGSSGAWSERVFCLDDSVSSASALAFEHGQAVLRGSGTGTGARSNRRSVFVAPGSPGGYSRMLSRWCGRAYGSGMVPQHGHGHGVGLQSDGKRRMAIVWHDIVFSSPHIFNLGVWEANADGTGFAVTGAAGAPDSAAFTGGSRTSNVVTLTGLPTDHGFTTEDVITVGAADTGYNGTFVVLDTPSSTSLRYNHTAADDASSGAGTIALARASATKNGLVRLIDITDAARTNGLVVATVPAGHPFMVGDSVFVDCTDATYDGQFFVTAIAETTVSWRQAAADDASSSTGTIQKVLPYWLESEWTGDLLRARVWPDYGMAAGTATAAGAGLPGPIPAGAPPWESAWGMAATLTGSTVPDPDRGEGCGLIASHLASGSTITEVRYDSLEITPLYVQ